MGTLSKEQLLDRLIESLRVLEINVQLYEAGEAAAWMPVATELYKLLIDDRYGPLVPELFPKLGFYPLRSRPSKSSERYELWSPGVKIEGGRLRFDLFDTTADRVELSAWLAQDIIEVKGAMPTIADFVTLMRHNISAHTSRKILGGKAGAIKEFAVFTEAGAERPAFTRILIEIALYLLDELDRELGRQPGPRLPLIEQRQLLEIVQNHNEAKTLMDEIVHKNATLTEKRMATIIQKLEVSACRLIPVELGLWTLLIYTHLGEAYRFLYFTTKNKTHLFRAVSALENARALLDDSSVPHQQALVFYNLGQIYSAASSTLGRMTCWEVSLGYFQELLSSVSPDEDRDLLADAAYQAGWLALKLLRVQTAIRYFRLYQTIIKTEST